MPTDKELFDIIEISDFTASVYMDTLGKTSKGLLEKMKIKVPYLNQIYGVSSSYNPDLELPFTVITNSQMDEIIRNINKRSKSIRQASKIWGLSSFVLGVDKGEREPLSSVTDFSKIVWGVV